MSQEITLSTRTTKAYPRKAQREKRSMEIYLCHHRVHLHIAIKLKEKENGVKSYTSFPHTTLRGVGSMRRGQISKTLTNGVPVVAGISCPHHSTPVGSPRSGPGPNCDTAVLQNRPSRFFRASKQANSQYLHNSHQCAWGRASSHAITKKKSTRISPRPSWRPGRPPTACGPGGSRAPAPPAPRPPARARRAPPGCCEPCRRGPSGACTPRTRYRG